MSFGGGLKYRTCIHYDDELGCCLRQLAYLLALYHYSAANILQFVALPFIIIHYPHGSVYYVF